MTDPFDREKLKRLAQLRVDRSDGAGPRRESTPSDLPLPELVRSMREIESAARTSHDRGNISKDFAVGMWTAMAAIRYDFSIEDARYVDTRYD